MNPEHTTCAECAFAVDQPESLARYGTLSCYRFPPPATTGQRPSVKATDWCGEFTPAAPGPPVEQAWRELSQLDVEAGEGIQKLTIEAEFRDLSEGGSWQPLWDHIEEIEENLAGNLGSHIKAGLRVRVPVEE